MKAYIYWLHLPEHDDMKSEGYIGVSTDHNKRFKAHKNGKKNNPHLESAFQKYGNEIQKHIIWLGEEADCYKNEEILRPEPYIGWNINKGGVAPPKITRETHPEVVKKNAENRRGKPSGMLGKHHKEESKQQTSEKMTGVPKSKKAKAASEAYKMSDHYHARGRKRITNGVIERFVPGDSLLPEGWWWGRPKEYTTRARNSDGRFQKRLVE